jgi:1-acyl-sn-glycerol-3-phosphate acyltransferase
MGYVGSFGGFVAAVRSLVRTVQAVAYFGWFGVELAVGNPKTRKERAFYLNRFCARMMRAFHIRFTVEGEFPKSGVVISNHTGYVDILLYAALSPLVYCAKAEMEHWFFIGWLTRMVGTVFVDRGAGGAAQKAAGGMEGAEAEGVPVVFFPEGTTSNGTVVLPFRTGLLAVSLQARQPMTPAFLRYTIEQDNGPDITVEKDVAFWGEGANMWTHIWKFLGLKGIHAFVKIADAPIQFSRPDVDRKVAAVEARAAVVRMAPETVQVASRVWDGKAAVVDYK